jgi:ABC-2 type transport system ATP-binding protein
MIELSFKSISKTYGNLEVLKNSSGKIANGITGILGVNGAGKTTFIKILAGLIEYNSGEFFLNGNALDLESQDWRNQIGYIPQSPGLYSRMSVYEYLDYMLLLSNWINRIKRENRINNILKEFNLTDYSTKPIGHLSGGTKQRVAIAQAFIHNPKIIILDEPANNLDAEERLRFHNYLLKLSDDKIILYIGHILNELASICSNILIIGKRTIQSFDGPENIIFQTKEFIKEAKIDKNDYKNSLIDDKSVLSISQINNEIFLRYDSRRVDYPDSIEVIPTLEEAFKLFNNST